MKYETIFRIINTILIILLLLLIAIIGNIIHDISTLQEIKVTSYNHISDVLITSNGFIEDYSDTEWSTDSKTYTNLISTEDQAMLCKLAYAEAGNQDVYGKLLVMLVVINRVESDKFPDSISEVIFARNQFSVTTNGMYENAPTDDPECLEALELVIQGYDISQGATYFESIKSYDSWHYKNLNFLFEHGDHWFYN